jgi:hypothetical protein
MMRWLFSVTAALALIACGLVHGFWTERWQVSPALQEASGRMDRLPLRLGTWAGAPIDVAPGQAGRDVAGCIQRRYTDTRTGATVVLALVCGRAGPVSIHTPEVCYGASGYAVDPPMRTRLNRPQESVEFWTADAVRTRTAETTRIRIYWGWNAGQGWQASGNPRLDFAREPVLYKLYVLRELEGPKDRPQPDPCETFLQTLLPALQQTLYAPSS